MERINRHQGSRECRLMFIADGANSADIARGRAAVMATFDNADVHIFAAALAAFTQERYSPPEGGELDVDALPGEECAWAVLWRETPEVALAAAGCEPGIGGWPFDFRLD